MSFSLLVDAEDNVTFLLHGESRAKDVVAGLVTESIEFHVEPYPDDQWCLTVKLESRSRVDAVLADNPPRCRRCDSDPDMFLHTTTGADCGKGCKDPQAHHAFVS